jgi:multiple sugar transport system permease protein
MEPRTRLGQVLSYVLLIASSALFLFPIAWMVMTSLKPIEQTNTTPTHWLPYLYEAQIGDGWIPVSRGTTLRSPMLVVQLEEGPEAGNRILISPDNYRDGRVYRTLDPAEPHYRATVLEEAEPGWIYVRHRGSHWRDPGGRVWSVVPPERIRSSVRFYWKNYPSAIRKMGLIKVWIPFLGERTIPIFWIYLRNTLIVCLLGVTGTLISCSLAAYSFARIPWRGRNVLFAITVATMMVPFPVLMVPLYGLFAKLGWVGTLLPLWVPAFFGTGFNIFLLRQFFLTIPRELSEAARIDGASELAILWRIILPLSKPALAVVALFHFLYAWNDFIGPLLYLTRRETFTLSLGLQVYQSQHGGIEWHRLMAASTIICLPIVVLFFIMQRTFIRGVATTGMKN